MKLKSGKQSNIHIIAEIGVNHDGSFTKAKKLIKAAKISGASAVKIQSYCTSEMISDSAKLANYQRVNSGQKFKNQLKLLEKYELSFNQQKKLYEYADEIGIDFLTSVFDFKSLDFVAHELQLHSIKIGSGELTNLPLIYRVGENHKKIIISTGMSTLKEIELALMSFYLGLIGQVPSLTIFRNKMFVQEFKDWLLNHGSDLITLLHCVSEYPTEIQNINLRSIRVLANEFGLPVGLSDHTTSLEVPATAVAFDICLIEKHLTLSNSDEGPDHAASLNPRQFATMVTKIQNAFCSLGSYSKIPSDEEIRNSKVVRKGIYTRRPLKKGEIIKETDIIVRRPENDCLPITYWDLIGKITQKDLAINQSLSEVLQVD